MDVDNHIPTSSHHTKTCCKCGETKHSLSFSVRKASKDGLHTYCKPCDKEVGRLRTAKEKTRVKVVPKSKKCPVCNTDKNSSEFGKCISRKDGLDIRCKECARYLSKLQHYRVNYGFTKEQTLNHLATQFGKCEICEKESKLYIDHNHNTAAVRGRICNNCNTILGHAKENEYVLLKAIQYLKDYK